MNFKQQAQRYYSKAPVIILGSGASAAHGLSGMGALASYLIQKTDITDLSDKDLESWASFSDTLSAGVDLETALHQVPVSELLTIRIISSTWALINSEDALLYVNNFGKKDIFPLGKLLRHMFGTSLSKINIITTNYDRLAEYACDQELLHHYTGFSHGLYRRLVGPNEVNATRRVNIWKVHGSLDWFKSSDNEVVALSMTNKIPLGFSPEIVTPGTQKYQRTHLEPYRSIIANADQAITAANSYLCIGYGFNDEHIQPKMIEKCTRNDAPVTVITRTLSNAARKIVIDGGIPNYLAIERGACDDQSIIYSSANPAPTMVEGNYWSLPGYLSIVI